MGSLDTEDILTEALCAELGAVVVSVGYRLAPESPYPADLDDCMHAVRWFADHAGSLIAPTGRSSSRTPAGELRSRGRAACDPNRRSPCCEELPLGDTPATTSPRKTYSAARAASTSLVTKPSTGCSATPKRPKITSARTVPATGPSSGASSTAADALACDRPRRRSRPGNLRRVEPGGEPGSSTPFRTSPSRSSRAATSQASTRRPATSS
jgi:hypothetical protein